MLKFSQTILIRKLIFHESYRVNKRQDYGLTDCSSGFNKKSGDWTLNKMTKPVAYHGWATKKVFWDVDALK